LACCTGIDAAVRFALILPLALQLAAAQAGDLVATVTQAGRGPVADAVVAAVPVDAAIPAPTTPPSESVAQIDKQFVPYVIAVRAGTEIEFPNHDNIRHHVYSFSQAKRFELPLYAGTPAEPVLFETPGVVTLGCNIHDWMISYVYVTETPWFATSAASGTATIPALPPGRYRVRVWHPRMAAGEDEATREVVIAGDAPVAEQWQLRLTPDLRPRRAPIGGQQGYR
jgi:plastocyanin